MKTYLISYSHGDGQWGFHIKAESMEDALARVESLRLTACLDGESIATFPFWMPLWIAFRWMALKEWLDK